MGKKKNMGRSNLPREKILTPVTPIKLSFRHDHLLMFTITPHSPRQWHIRCICTWVVCSCMHGEYR